MSCAEEKIAKAEGRSGGVDSLDFFVVSLEQNNYFDSVKEEAPRLTIVLLL